MRLKEFIDKSGNQVKIPKTVSKTSTGNTSSGGFKKRFEKLLNYAKNHKAPEVLKASIKSISEDGFFYTEEKRKVHSGGFSFYDTDIQVYIGPQTEAWRLRVYEDNTLEEDISGMGWPELLKNLRSFITVPTTGTPEYKDLIFKDSKEDFLKEFVDSKGNKVNLKNSSSKPAANSIDDTYRFERLVAQIEADNLCDIQVHGLTGSVLAFTTDRFVVVRIERKRSFPPYILQVGNHADAYADYEEVLGALIEEGIIANTDLCESASLQEFVDKNGNKVVLNKTSSASQPMASTTLYKDKFKKLLNYHLSNDYNVKHGSSQGTIEILSEDDDKALFKYKDTWEDGVGKKHETIIAAAYFKGDSTWWVIRYVDSKPTEDFVGSEFNELVKKLYRYFTLPPTNSSEYQDLLESTSFAEDFKTYENLWD